MKNTKSGDCEKLLGIKFVSKLTLDPHVEDLCKKSSGPAAAYLTQNLAEFTKDARKKMINFSILEFLNRDRSVSILHS